MEKNGAGNTSVQYTGNIGILIIMGMDIEYYRNIIRYSQNIYWGYSLGYDQPMVSWGLSILEGWDRITMALFEYFGLAEVNQPWLTSCFSYQTKNPFATRMEKQLHNQ